MSRDSMPEMNMAKRLPIVFCLDVSPSMGWKIDGNSSSMELLNEALNNFIRDLKRDPKLKSSVEIAFVTFSTGIENETDFKTINTIKPENFVTVKSGKSRISKAVLYSIQKLETRRNQLEQKGIGYYAPFLVLITDGNPDQNDNRASYQKALDAIQRHCHSHVGASEIIVPYIIGVGDFDESTLNNYASAFKKGFFQIRGNGTDAKADFYKAFMKISSSTKHSQHLNMNLYDSTYDSSYM